MLVIGYHLAGARLGSVLRARGAHPAAAIRLVIYPLPLLAALYPLRAHLEPTMACALAMALLGFAPQGGMC